MHGLHEQLETSSSEFKYKYIHLKQSSKTTVKNDKMKIVLIKSYQHLKLYFILCILYV